MPIFSKFGKVLKSHRLLRQYVWLALLPYTFATLHTNYYFLNQTEKLWKVHASRLNAGYSSPHLALLPTPRIPSTPLSNCR